MRPLVALLGPPLSITRLSLVKFHAMSLRYCSMLATSYRGSCGLRVRAGTLAGAVGFAVAIAGGAAHADDDVDTAVDAVVIAGSIAGVTIDATETTLIKDIVRCAINQTPVVYCARVEIIKLLLPATPQDAQSLQPLITCILNQTPVDQCGLAEILRLLPPQAPPQARDIVRCIAQRTDIGECGKQLALNAAQKEAFDTIEKLKADGRSELGSAGSGAIRNIIGLSAAIRDQDWVSFGVYGGTEVYKAAAKVVLRIVIPGGSALGQVIDPIVDTVVQSRVDLAVGLVKAAKARDEPTISRLIIEFYLTAQVEIPCSLFNLLPPGDVTSAIREATCGTLGDAIRAIGGAGSEIVEISVDVFRDILTGIGIDPTGIFGDDPQCGTTASYFANKYAVCMKQSAFLDMTDPTRSGHLYDALLSQCRSNFAPCNKVFLGGIFGPGPSEKLDEVCNPLRDRYRQDVEHLVAGLQSMAKNYADSQFVVPINPSFAGMCEAAEAVRSFLSKCVNVLGAQTPGLRSANWSRCGDQAGNVPMPQIFETECTAAAMAKVGTGAILEEVCAPAGIVALTTDTSLLETVPPIIIEAIQPPFP
jgi:hypothetical protein